eukprot:9393431-Pyramimonas_sp.AAC.1
MAWPRQVAALDGVVSGSQVSIHSGPLALGQSPDVVQGQIGHGICVGGEPVADECSAQPLAGRYRPIEMEFVYETCSC